MRIYKHLRKRGLALLMALVMCLSLLPATAMAGERKAEPTQTRVVPGVAQPVSDQENTYKFGDLAINTPNGADETAIMKLDIWVDGCTENDSLSVGINPGSSQSIADGITLKVSEGSGYTLIGKLSQYILHLEVDTATATENATAINKALEDYLKVNLTAKLTSDEIDYAVQFGSITAGYAYNPANGHYYTYQYGAVDDQGNPKAGPIAWTDARDKARAMTYDANGVKLTGYLTTITSDQEQLFIQNLFKGEFWTAGTRNSEHYNENNEHDAHKGVFSENVAWNAKVWSENTRKRAAETSGAWFWGDGPELGQIYFPFTISPNTNIGWSVIDQYQKEFNSDPQYCGRGETNLVDLQNHHDHFTFELHGEKIYNNWSKDDNGNEPNDYERTLKPNVTAADKHLADSWTNLYNETYMHVWGPGTNNQQNLHWNDFNTNSDAIKGFLVEFGGFEDETGGKDVAPQAIAHISPVKGKEVTTVFKDKDTDLIILPESQEYTPESKGPDGNSVPDGAEIKVTTPNGDSVQDNKITTPGRYEVVTTYTDGDDSYYSIKYLDIIDLAAAVKCVKAPKSHPATKDIASLLEGTVTEVDSTATTLTIDVATDQYVAQYNQEHSAWGNHTAVAESVRVDLTLDTQDNTWASGKVGETSLSTATGGKLIVPIDVKCADELVEVTKTAYTDETHQTDAESATKGQTLYYQVKVEPKLGFQMKSFQITDTLVELNSTNANVQTADGNSVVGEWKDGGVFVLTTAATAPVYVTYSYYVPWDYTNSDVTNKANVVISEEETPDPVDDPQGESEKKTPLKYTITIVVVNGFATGDGLDDPNVADSVRTYTITVDAGSDYSVNFSADNTDEHHYALDSVTVNGKTPGAAYAPDEKGSFEYPFKNVSGDITMRVEYAPDDVGDPTDPDGNGPDGIPDKYEVKVTFLSVGGSLGPNGGKDLFAGSGKFSNLVVYVPLYTDGELSVEGTNKLTSSAGATDQKTAQKAGQVIPAAGNHPDGWHVKAGADWIKSPVGEEVTTNAEGYTYTFVYLPKTPGITVNYLEKGTNNALKDPHVVESYTKETGYDVTKQVEGEDVKTLRVADDNYMRVDYEITADPAGKKYGLEMKPGTADPVTLTINVYYELDNVGDPDDPDGNGPDGIPDRYEVKVTFLSVGGDLGPFSGVDLFTGAKKFSKKTVYVPLYDENGKFSENGTNKLALTPADGTKEEAQKDGQVIPAAGHHPYAGHRKSGAAWDSDLTAVTVQAKADGYTYTYIYPADALTITVNYLEEGTSNVLETQEVIPYTVADGYNVSDQVTGVPTITSDGRKYVQTRYEITPNGKKVGLTAAAGWADAVNVVINVYYEKTYTVTYQWTGVHPNVPVPVDGKEYRNGEPITLQSPNRTSVDVYSGANVIGTWTFSDWTDPQTTVNGADVVISGAWHYNPVKVFNEDIDVEKTTLTQEPVNVGDTVTWKITVTNKRTDIGYEHLSLEDILTGTLSEHPDYNIAGVYTNVGMDVPATPVPSQCTFVIHYQYADGSPAAPDYFATVFAGDPAISVPSPEIEDYTPDQEAVNVEITDENPGNKEITVTYTPNPPVEPSGNVEPDEGSEPVESFTLDEDFESDEGSTSDEGFEPVESVVPNEDPEPGEPMASTASFTYSEGVVAVANPSDFRLAPDASVEFIVTYKVKPGDAMGDTWLKNSVTVKDISDPNNPDKVVGTDDSDPVDVLHPNLEVVKTRTSADTARVGDIITWTITITNNGDGTAYDVNVADANADSLSQSTIASIAPNGVVEITASHVVTGREPLENGKFYNTAVVTYKEEDPGKKDPTDPPEEPKQTEDKDDGTDIPVDLAVTKTASATTVYAGDNVTYTITVTNTGHDAENVTVTDGLDSQLTFVSATLNGAPITPAGSVYNIGSVTNTTPATLSITVRVNSGVPANTVIRNIAVADYAGRNPDDPAPSDSTNVTVTEPYNPIPDIPFNPTPTPTPTPTPVTPTPTPTTPGGTTITDDQTPLAGSVGLNDTDHFAYVIGYEDDTVRPLNNITRAEAATIFFRLMTDEYRQANWSTTNSFSDVNAGDWYNNAVSTCANAGVLKGYEDGTFRPNAAITRAEFASMAAGFMDESITDDGTGDFSDTANHWAAVAIRRAAKAGWVTGNGNKFNPDAKITRAEVMTIVNRMLDRTPDKDHMLPEMKKWTDNPKSEWYYEAVQEATNEHEYERDELNVETWTELLTVRDWKALETEWANNGGASALKADDDSGSEQRVDRVPDGI